MTETIKEYSEALFIIAEENGKTEEFSKTLLQIREVFLENPDYIQYLASPAIPLSERLCAIDEAFSAETEEDIVSFMKLLCEHGRIIGILECIDEFSLLKMQRENRVSAKIISAVPLSDEQKTALCQKLEKKTGKNVDATYVIDESVLGGIKVEMEGMTLDGSTKKRLNEIKGVMSDE
ncbi:MAG: ATP synthase F1 subunit delta [Clostridia bacterium]|nr:ATP synthase F1 subunit delta [Clostridia bacterium]